jgi:phage I-like protein
MKRENHKGQISLSVELTTERTAPHEFRIFRAGDNESEKGTFTFDKESALSVMSTYKSRGKALLFDFNHGTTFSNPTPEMAMSAGDFVPEVRNGELWATACNWNDYGRQMLEGGKYRFFSPLFNHDKGRITWLRNVALTNLPALDNIEPLVAADANEGDDPMEKCSACADKDAKLAALSADFEAFKKKKAEPDGDEKLSAALTSGVVALTGKSDLNEAMGVLRANKKAAEEIEALRADVTKQAEAKLSTDFDTLIDECVTSLRVLPAEKATFRADYLQDGKVTSGSVAQLRTFIKHSAPKMNGTATAQKQTGASPVTPEMTAMAKTMGVDIEAFTKAKATSLQGGA